MGLEVLKAEFALLMAKVEEADLYNKFDEYLEKEWNYYDFDRASEIIRDETAVRE